jgi:hypothetical protein
MGICAVTQIAVAGFFCGCFVELREGVVPPSRHFLQGLLGADWSARRVSFFTQYASKSPKVVEMS